MVNRLGALVVETAGSLAGSDQQATHPAADKLGRYIVQQSLEGVVNVLDVAK